MLAVYLSAMKISKTGYGVDVSATRADELERRLLEMVTRRVVAGDEVSVLDLGCGAGGAAARLQRAGAAVIGVDRYDFSNQWLGESGTFVLGDVQQVLAAVPEYQFDYGLCNRTLHYLPYKEALQVLIDLRQVIRSSGQLSISFSGVTSDLARGYTVCQEPIASRFGKLSTADQKTFGITAPLTLYTQAEAVQLLTAAGWGVTWSRTTDFGNVLIEAVV